MTVDLTSLKNTVTDLESAVTASGAKVDAAIAELTDLKTKLDQAIAAGASIADLQSISSRISAVTTALQVKTQALADSEAVNAPGN